MTWTGNCGHESSLALGMPHEIDLARVAGSPGWDLFWRAELLWIAFEVGVIDVMASRGIIPDGSR